jgi:predicted glycosyltransferase
MHIVNTHSLRPRVMMYSQDGFGLGHMRRTTLIANQLLRLRADACVLTLGDSRLGQFFDAASNHDYLKLPSILKVGPGDWRAINLPLPFAEVHAMRKQLIHSAVMSFNPHILLVDHMPHGAMGELLPTLEALRASGSHTKVVLGLRDILDAPAVVQRVWRAEGAYDAIERFYDQVLIYGPQEVFDLPAQYGFSPAMADKARFCGYVCTPEAARYTARARAKYLSGAGGATKLIVAMAGGGADAYPFMRALLEALPALQAQQPCTLALITGPFMPAEQRRDLEARARGLPAHVSRSVSDTLSYIEAADLVVAMAGYNTTMEILRSGKRALLIPRVGPSAEQRMRASLCAAQGWVDMIDPDDLCTERIAQVVASSLRSAPAGTAMARPYLDGLNAAAEQLLALLPEPPAAAPAMLQGELLSAPGALVYPAA